MNKSTIFLVLVTLILAGCGQNKPEYKKVDVSDVSIQPIDIQRYEKDLFSSKDDNLSKHLDSLKKKYYFFLGDDPTAKEQLMRMRNYLNDPLLIELYEKTRDEYSSLSKVEKNLTRLFRYFKHYFPEKNIPEVYTYISGIDHRYPVQYHDSVMIIAIDMYLGKDFDAYKKVNIPNYKARTYTQEYIKIDVANSIAKSYIKPQRAEGKFIDHMIYYGKLLYFKDALLPDITDNKKIKYTEKQLEWCKANEEKLWTFIVENDLLFSGNYNDFKKLLSPGPFTSEFGQNSAPRIGWWVGWQIARAYMNENPETPLIEFMKMKNSQEILKRSKYKP